MIQISKLVSLLVAILFIVQDANSIPRSHFRVMFFDVDVFNGSESTSSTKPTAIPSVQTTTSETPMKVDDRVLNDAELIPQTLSSNNQDVQETLQLKLRIRQLETTLLKYQRVREILLTIPETEHETTKKHESDLITTTLAATTNKPDITTTKIEIIPTCPSAIQPVWVPSSKGQIPFNAFEGGKEETYKYFSSSPDKKIYVARAVHNKLVIPGKMVDGHQAAYIGVGDAEVSLSNYEILTKSTKFEWAKYNNGTDLHKGLISGGIDADGKDIYIGRAPYTYGSERKSNIEVGAFYPDRHELVITYNYKTIAVKDNIELLFQLNSLCK